MEDVISLDRTNEENNTFVDSDFVDEHIEHTEEIIYMLIQTVELSEAKEMFNTLATSQRIRAIRFIFSKRLFLTELLPKPIEECLRAWTDKTIGSLCSMNVRGTQCIGVENHIITRVLYICEDLSEDEICDMETKLFDVDMNYKVVMDVIKNRLRFHQGKKD